MSYYNGEGQAARIPTARDLHRPADEAGTIALGYNAPGFQGPVYNPPGYNAPAHQAPGYNAPGPGPVRPSVVRVAPSLPAQSCIDRLIPCEGLQLPPSLWEWPDS